MPSLSVAGPFLMGRCPGLLCAFGMLSTKARAPGGTLVPEWFGSLVFGRAVVACGAVVHVCGTFRGLFRERECRLLSANNEIGGEFTVEAVLRSLSGATFFRRVLEVVRSVRASPRCRPVRLSRICSASSSNCRCGRTADWDGTDDWGYFRACR